MRELWKLIPLVLGVATAAAQGTFSNLNFESPILPLNPDLSFQVPITNALPGWQGCLGANNTTVAGYDALTLGAAGISIHDSLSSRPPIQGNYSAMLQPQFNPYNLPDRDSAAIAQTGQLPANSLSLRFYSGSEFMQASFAGQNIPLLQLGLGGSGVQRYLILGGDISAFAGQTGELRFTMPSVAYSYNLPYLDNITFSPQPIPEPTSLALLGLAALALPGRRLTHQPERRLQRGSLNSPTLSGE